MDAAATTPGFNRKAVSFLQSSASRVLPPPLPSQGMYIYTRYRYVDSKQGLLVRSRVKYRTQGMMKETTEESRRFV